MSRQFIAVTFRPGDRQTYTYHNDGEPVAVGDRVRVPDRSGDGWQAVTVASIDVPAPTKFETKAILGLVEVPAEPVVIHRQAQGQAAEALTGDLFGKGKA